MFEEYSTSHGGKYLASKKVKAQDEKRFIYDYKKRPAFYLHKKTAEYPQGDNAVIHLPEEEFILEDIRLIREEKGVYLKWNAIVNDNIHFEIYQIKETTPVFVAEVQPMALSQKNEYNSTLLDRNYSYVLKVIKNESKLRYEHVVTNLAIEPNVSVYPTITSGKVQVDLGDMDFAHYTITTVNGQQVQKGKFNNVNNSISLEGTAGVYLITIWNEQIKVSKHITVHH